MRQGSKLTIPFFFIPTGTPVSNIAIGGPKATQQMPTAKEADARIRDVSELYEKQFLREMVKAMRSTVQSGGLTEPSMAENIFREKLDHEYVESWGDNGGIGLADVIYHQLKDRFGGGPQLFPPQGPVQIKKGTNFKIDETKPIGIPVVPSQVQEKGKDLTYQINVEENRDVLSPWSGRVSQSFSGPDERQTVKLEHDNGLVTTLVFNGRSERLIPGEAIAAGQMLGRVSPDHGSLTWQLLEVRNG
jgi:peptidoglycan hydrolase FlgJ